MFHFAPHDAMYTEAPREVQQAVLMEQLLAQHSRLIHCTERVAQDLMRQAATLLAGQVAR